MEHLGVVDEEELDHVCLMVPGWFFMVFHGFRLVFMVFLENVPPQTVFWPNNPVKVRRPKGGIGPSVKKSCKIRFPNQVTSTSTSTSTPCYHQHLFSGGIINKDSCQVIFLIRYRDRRDRKDHKEKSYKRDISIYKKMIYDLFWLAFPFFASSLDFDVPPSSP